MGALNVGVPVLKFTSVTLAAAPPHSAPQLRIKAWVSLALNTPVNGWSLLAPVIGVTVRLPTSITKKALVFGGANDSGLSLKASSFDPLGLSTRRVTRGTITE